MSSLPSSLYSDEDDISSPSATPASSSSAALDQHLMDDISTCSGYDSDEFYGRDVQDCPNDQVDDDLGYLHESDLAALHQCKVRTEDWRDRFISDVGEACSLGLDQSKKESWDLCKEEILHIQKSVHDLLDMDMNEAIPLEKIVELALGLDSDFYSILSKELSIDKVQYFKFIGALCLQMS